MCCVSCGSMVWLMLPTATVNGAQEWWQLRWTAKRWSQGEVQGDLQQQRLGYSSSLQPVKLL